MPSQGQSPRPSIVFLFFILLFLCPSVSNLHGWLFEKQLNAVKGQTPFFLSHMSGRGVGGISLSFCIYLTFFSSSFLVERNDVITLVLNAQSTI